jgi:hypothetical protein
VTGHNQNISASKQNKNQNEEKVHRMRENLCSSSSEKGLIARICKEVQKLNSQQTKDPINRRVHEQTVFKRRSTND